jgi:RHS repeat-associated protein
MALGESPSAQAQVESRRHHSRAPSERRALGAWGPLRIAQPSDVWLDATYDAWGNVQNFKLDGVDQGTDTSTWPIPHGFAGGLFDSDTGLVRFGVRDYDPLIGRWTARDPILFEGGQANLYVCVGDDPTMRIDPGGLGSITNNSDRGVYVRDENFGMKYLAPGESYEAADGFYNDGSFDGDYFRKVNTPTDITIYNSGERRFFPFDSGLDRLADDLDAFRRGNEGPGWKSFKWYNERFIHPEDKMCPM